MSAAVLPLRPSPMHRNQALADLYRARSTLAEAGVQGEYVVGSADDGSPWLAVCAPNGEALIHVAIIDGEVVADSPALAHPLRGRQVGVLLKALLERLPLQALRSNGAFLAIAAALALRVVTEINEGAAFNMPAEAQPLLDALAELPAVVVLAAINREVARFVVEQDSAEHDHALAPSRPIAIDGTQTTTTIQVHAAQPLERSSDGVQASSGMPQQVPVEVPVPAALPEPIPFESQSHSEKTLFPLASTPSPLIARSASNENQRSEIQSSPASEASVSETTMSPEEGKRFLAEWEAQQNKIPKAVVEMRGADKVITYLEGDYTNMEFIYNDGTKFIVFGIDKEAPPEIYYIP